MRRRVAPARLHVAAVEFVGEREHLVVISVLRVLDERLPAPACARQHNLLCTWPAARACYDSIVKKSSMGAHRGMLAFAYLLRTMADCAADVYPIPAPTRHGVIVVQLAKASSLHCAAAQPHLELMRRAQVWNSEQYALRGGTACTWIL